MICLEILQRAADEVLLQVSHMIVAAQSVHVPHTVVQSYTQSIKGTCTGTYVEYIAKQDVWEDQRFEQLQSGGNRRGGSTAVCKVIRSAVPVSDEHRLSFRWVHVQFISLRPVDNPFQISIRHSD